MAYEERKIGGNGHVTIQEWSPVDQKGHHKKSNEIENDIESTRHSMDLLMDSLSGRFHPKSIIDTVFDMFQKSGNRETMQDTFTNIANRISDSFQKNPVPLLLIGVGSALYFWEERKSSNYIKVYNEKSPDTSRPDFKEKMGDIKGQAGEKFGQFKESSQAGMEHLREKGEQLRSQMKDSVSDIREKTYERSHETAQYFMDNPVVTGAISLVFGLLAGSLIPETPAEKRSMGPMAEQATEKIKEQGQAAMEKGQNIAGSAIQTAKEEVAKNEGLPTEQTPTSEKTVIREEKTYREPGLPEIPPDEGNRIY